jgi:hypothetical protein
VRRTERVRGSYTVLAKPAIWTRMSSDLAPVPWRRISRGLGRALGLAGRVEVGKNQDREGR